MVPKGIGVGIVGMGSFLPDEIRTNDWWSAEWREHYAAALARDVMGSVDVAAHRGAAEVDPEVRRYAKPYFADLFRGVKERRVMSADMLPSDMEAHACRAALAEAGISAQDVDALIGFGLVNDFVSVENTGLVAQKLGLRPEVASFEVSAACSSFVQQLRVASRLVQTGEFDTVLVYVSSAASLVTDYASPSSVVPGDGAMAAVIRRVDPDYGYIASASSTQGEYHDGILIVPRDVPTSPWYKGEGGPFLMKRVDSDAAHYMGSRAASTCKKTVTRLLEQTGATADDIDFLAVSQAGAWFSRALADAIGLDHAKILEPEHHFERYGHLMAASMPLNLLLARRLGKVRRGSLVLAFSPGVGFVTAASLIRWSLDG